MSEQGEVITFSDVAGVDEAKEELEEIVVSSCPTVTDIKKKLMWLSEAYF